MCGIHEADAYMFAFPMSSLFAKTKFVTRMNKNDLISMMEKRFPMHAWQWNVKETYRKWRMKTYTRSRAKCHEIVVDAWLGRHCFR